MLNLVKNLQTNIKVKFDKPYKIDNFAFKCHYRYSMYLLLILTLLVTSQELIGEHIKCLADQSMNLKVINTFCFFTSTFTVVKYLDRDMVNEHSVPYPGVGAIGLDSEEPIKRHAYYQWVPFVLFLQALTFYVPHFIWKRQEGGRMKNAVQGLEYAAYVTETSVSVGKGKTPTKSDIDGKFAVLTNAFKDHIIINRNWTTWLIICEFLNLFNLVWQIVLTNVFLGGEFIGLGPKMIQAGLDSEVNILDKVFPKITKCIFHKYGSSGTVQNHDAMCVMALNIINEKIFAILWFWYIILFVISIWALLWRLLTAIFHNRSAYFNRVAFAEFKENDVNPYKIMNVMQKSSYVDWMFLTYMSKNMDSLVFQRFLQALKNDLYENKYIEDDYLDKEEPLEDIYSDIPKKGFINTLVA